MPAFEMNVLIRLKNINHYCPQNLSEMDNRLYIHQKDKSLYIAQKVADLELNKLIKDLSLKLWEDEKSQMLYYTEMLLFSIADSALFNDITNRLSIKITDRNQ